MECERCGEPISDLAIIIPLWTREESGAVKIVRERHYCSGACAFPERTTADCARPGCAREEDGMIDAEVPAGVLLDALVAERVMGREVTWTPEDGDPNIARFVSLGSYSAEPCPPYSSDIAAAWLVVERMRERDVDVMLYRGERRGMPPELRDPSDDQWECALWWLDGGEHRETTQYADTAPLAICRAALAALGDSQ